MITPHTNNTFCMAKWLQVTIDLHHGVSKSCHHTNWTKIDAQKVLENPHYLHNTQEKQNEREQMLSNNRPKSCSFCWDFEDTVSKSQSDRFKKSNSDWAKFGLKNNDTLYVNPIPSYVEVMFDKKCNLSCVYCSPDSSSLIEQEIKRHGNFPEHVSEHRSSRLTKSDYKKELISAFFNWLPELLPKLHTLRVTGGEPLLSQHLTDLILVLSRKSFHHLTFAVNTNLMLPPKIIHDFIKKINKLSKQVKSVHLYTSIEAYGIGAEFIRSGLNYDQFIKNLTYVLENAPQTSVTIISTVNKLAAKSFTLFLNDVLILKKRFKHLTIDFVPLNQPNFLSINNLSIEEKEYFKESFNFIHQNQNYFSKNEIQQMENILLIIHESQENKNLVNDFETFINEYKKRVTPLNYSFSDSR